MSLKYSACNSRHSYTDTEIRIITQQEASMPEWENHIVLLSRMQEDFAS